MHPTSRPFCPPFCRVRADRGRFRRRCCAFRACLVPRRRRMWPKTGRSLRWGPGARVVPLPAFPLMARRMADRRYPRWETVWSAARKRYEPGRGYSQDGYVWQAEESASGRCFYGFVGSHDIARVPAEDMEFPPPPYVWTRISPGLDGGLTRGSGQIFIRRVAEVAGQPMPRHAASAFAARHAANGPCRFSAGAPRTDPALFSR